MKHLKGGVKKGAFDDAEAQKRFDAWKNGKDAKNAAVREGDAKAKKEAAAKELEAEKKMNEAIIASTHGLSGMIIQRVASSCTSQSVLTFQRRTAGPSQTTT